MATDVFIHWMLFIPKYCAQTVTEICCGIIHTKRVVAAVTRTFNNVTKCLRFAIECQRAL